MVNGYVCGNVSLYKVCLKIEEFISEFDEVKTERLAPLL